MILIILPYSSDGSKIYLPEVTGLPLFENQRCLFAFYSIAPVESTTFASLFYS
jgi:hypothetical protein